jgi:hypothetical protein
MQRILIRLWLAVAGLVALAILGVAVLVVSTSRPPIPPVLPTATAPPSADPNLQVLAVLSSGAQVNWAGIHLHYEPSASNGDPSESCASGGRWSLEINPEDIVGHPYSSPPSMGDWRRAAEAVAEAVSICPAPLDLNWVGHDPRRPQSDRWSAALPPERVRWLDGASLRAYALQHAQQQ